METLAAGAEKQVCPSCRDGQIKRTTLTSLVVYFRCEMCGNVWSIPERRAIPRATDPRRF